MKDRIVDSEKIDKSSKAAKVEEQIVLTSEFESCLKKIWNEVDVSNYVFLSQSSQNQKKLEQQFRKCKGTIRTVSQQSGKSHNHVDHNYHLANKKALFYNIRNYSEANQLDPFEFIPVTFHVINGIFDKEF